MQENQNAHHVYLGVDHLIIILKVVRGGGGEGMNFSCQEPM